MTFEITTSSFRLANRQGRPAAEAVRAGLLAGGAGIFFALIGAYAAMNARFIIDGWLTLSQAAMLSFGIAAGLGAALKGPPTQDAALPLSRSLIAGLVYGAVMAAFLLLIRSVELRTYLVAANPMLVRALSFVGEPGSLPAAGTLVAAGTATALLGGLVGLLSARWRGAVLIGLLTVAMAGLFRDIAVDILNNVGLRPVQLAAFGPEGVKLWAACALALAAAAWRYRSAGRPATERDPLRRRRIGIAVLVAAMVLAPFVTSAFIAQVLVLVALYTLMGMGLHIELGLAGLVDLGFVAFYAVGAYTVALLCSSSPVSIAQLSFWAALPIAILLAAFSGFVFGLPVLRVRGDYLALATLGLGEIIRVLVVSDLTRPLLGGSQGIIGIDRPMLGGEEIGSPIAFYGLALGLAGIAAFVSSRLQSSKMGRAWVAVREDEDVAQALGIDLVAVKLCAYIIGAGFAGASGAVFAVMIGAVYPHSFQLLISVNLLSIIVIGGLGSLPGVVMGSLVLIGLPELLREFGEFRYLFYGIALVAMVRFRPEGLWPAMERTSRHGS
ncbi:branched-chain amino acid ABC transporter permease [Labrys wisconsinensis]|uniref:Branched-chain amino acid transport system permease protein n=1 Tax=Labrys wisconsinensis TaxID=425677 RepID=A0ABU0JCT6_9HYPH|nr:branched-chain amino acid ABC transporter permease [Labrys wisconsinensis]MDQ0472100.1 branched-chain amino acid transport system permease protein [Labrys wisconsinensis]